jgi:VWFA-related protein
MQVARRELVFAVVATILRAQPAWGPDEIRSTNHPYEPPSATALKVQTNLVEVAVVVRDSHGRAIGALSKDDFAIYDEGKKREITAFSFQTAAGTAPAAANGNVPGVASAPAETAKSAEPARFVALYFDDYNIAAGDLARTKIAAERLVKEVFRPADRVAIFTTSSAQRLDFTSDRAKLLEAIEKVSAHPRVNPDGILPCPRITPYQAYRIVINDPVAWDAAIKEAYVCVNGPPAPAQMQATDASFFGSTVRSQSDATWQQAKQVSQDTLAAILNAVDGLSRMPGTRVLVLASSGFVSDTLELEQQKIVDHAVRAGVVINSLDAKGLYAEDPQRMMGMVRGGDIPPSTFVFEQTTAGARRMEATYAIADLAESTGGWFFQNRNDLDAGFRLGLRPETTYLLGFSPTNLQPDGKYHKLNVRLSHAGSDHIAARPGYFAPSAAPEKSSAAKRKIDVVVSGTDASGDVPARFVVEPKQTGDAHEVSVTLVVDVRQLKFDRKKDRQVQDLTFVAALFDQDGNFVAGKEGEVALSLKDGTYERFLQTGFSTRVSIPVSPGSFRFRAVVQEAVDGKITASNDAVQVP